MQTKILTAIFLFAAFGATQDVDVDLDDFPRSCQQACRDISQLSSDCDRQTGNDRDERDCVCNANNAQQQAESCAACVKAYGRDDDDDDDDDYDDDIVDLFRACSWNYADVSATSSSGTASSTQGTSGTSSAVTMTQTFPASTTTATDSGVTTTQTFPASTVTSTQSTSPAQTDNPDSAAAGVNVGVGIIAAGLMAALPVVL
ncbi:hypothetical protein GQX73_g9395 [Xylaria multiplex]|uniref:Extracellular membrane protein CFEM domain-containing protein n=1 Tax=Xylaria multiplex TaxID=323545 RepID=A0A7C8MLF3_9PEZI|nr:hypothetical protein GQX73_g9395 [Xylaria multiplex]